MEFNVKDPKQIAGGAVILLGMLGGGAALGLTIEPEETTELRIEKVRLEERLTYTEKRLEKTEAHLSDAEEKLEQAEETLGEARIALRDLAEACRQ
jgi:chromosome segregation ATPase